LMLKTVHKKKTQKKTVLTHKKIEQHTERHWNEKFQVNEVEAVKD
jgi:hypothetical protein